jgi:hypothetical protein
VQGAVVLHGNLLAAVARVPLASAALSGTAVRLGIYGKHTYLYAARLMPSERCLRPAADRPCQASRTAQGAGVPSPRRPGLPGR